MRKTRSPLRALADGGSPNPEMLGSGLAGRAARALAGRRKQIDDIVDQATGGGSEEVPPAATATPQTPGGNAPANKRKGGLRNFFALADGGRVRGPGSRTDDKVGPVMLSDEEYVLPADTADAIGRERLDAIRLATHDFEDDSKKDVLERKVVGLADGGSPWVADNRGNVRRPGEFPKLPAPEPRAPAWTADAAGNVSRGGDALRLPPPGDSVRTSSSLVPVQRGNVAPYGSAASQRVPFSNAIDVAAKEVAPAAQSTAKSLLRSAGTPITGIVGAAQSLDDLSTGYRDHFQRQMGVTTPAGSVAADAARTLANVGDAATFGLAGRVGRGISGAMGGSGFVSGFLSPSDRDQYEAQRTQRVMQGGGQVENPGPASRWVAPGRSDQDPAVGVPPNSYQSKRLSEMGVPLEVQNSRPVIDSAQNRTDNFLKRGGTDQFQNLGTYGGNANIYGRSSDPSRPGRINEFVGVGNNASPNSAPEDPLRREMLSALRNLGGRSTNGGEGIGYTDRSASINKRFDKLADDLSSMYGPKGRGNLARRLLELETARASALDANERNLTTRENAQLQSSTARENAQLSARNSILNTMAQMDSARSSGLRAGQDAMQKALLDAQKFARDTEEKGFERYSNAIGQMFVKRDKDGNEVVDKGAQERFRSFVEASDPQAGEKFAAMSPQQQQYMLQNFKTLFDMNEKRNKTAKSGSMMSNTGGVTNRMDMPVDVREATWNDYWNNNLPLTDYLWSNLPGTNKNVVVTESGQPVLYSDYTTTNGATDLDKVKIVDDAVRKHRSSLRNH